VCDSEIDAEARVCDVCQSDLRVFDVDADVLGPAHPQPPRNLDALIESIGHDKEVQPDLFEDIKNVGKATAAGAIAKDRSGAASGPRATAAGPSFECPACGLDVAADSRECPQCHAQFSEEKVEQFECPACGATVAEDAASCPSCGVRFAPQEEWQSSPREASPPERSPIGLGPIEAASPGSGAENREPEPVREVELRTRIAAIRKSRDHRPPPVEVADRRALYGELPKLVNAVKPLLLGAKAAKVDIAGERRLINEAIASGKARDIERAVRLVNQAKVRLEDAFAVQLADRAEALVGDLERARVYGGNLAPVVPFLSGALEPLEGGRYLEAADRLALAREMFETRATGYHRAQKALAAADALVEDARSFGIDVQDAARLALQGRDAFARRDWEAAARFGGQEQDEVRKALPKALKEEMNRARNVLLEMKIRGVDLARPIGILKQASIHLKREEFAEALRYIRKYRQEVDIIQPATAR